MMKWKQLFLSMSDEEFQACAEEMEFAVAKRAGLLPPLDANEKDLVCQGLALKACSNYIRRGAGTWDEAAAVVGQYLTHIGK